MDFEVFKQMLIDALTADVGDDAEDYWSEVLQGETGVYIRVKEGYEKVPIKSVEYLDGKSGGEGSGEYCYAVVKFNDTGKIYQVDFNYYSYEGVTFEYASVQEVVPQEVLVTQYVPV